MATFAVIGMGARGRKYTNYLLQKGQSLVGVCDADQSILAYSKKTFNLEDTALFKDYDSFFKKGKIADFLIISTTDAEHIKSAIPALKIGYDLLLEKPIATTLEDCLSIEKLAKQLNRRVSICHVLRYSPFFETLKKELDSKKFGKIMHIDHIENVGWWHYAHSYVRGNWRNEKESTFMLLAKCCHDLDIISYLSQEDCVSVSSFGNLSYFKKENQPSCAANHCFQCSLANCKYNALEWYSKNPLWVKLPEIISDQKEQFIRNWLSNEQNPYGRCVFACDNDVVDHQVVNMQFKNDMTATLTMIAFSEKFYRHVHVFCTEGEIIGDMAEKKIHCKIFNGEEYTIDLEDAYSDAHGGGDERLINDLVDILNGKEETSRTNIEVSFMSHKIAFAAEESRKNAGKLVKIDEYGN